MFNRLIDLFLDFIYLFQFWYVVQPYQGAVVVTLGRWARTKGPGTHLKWPFNIDKILIEHVVLQTVEISPQSLTTKDGVSVVVTPEALFLISDLRTFMLDLDDGEKVVINVIKSRVAEYFRSKTWDELKENERLCDEITTKCKYGLTRKGVTIEAILLSDMVQSRSYRLWQTQSVIASY